MLWAVASCPIWTRATHSAECVAPRTWPVVAFLASADVGYVTGQRVTVDGGGTAPPIVAVP
jgi:NAD(P)-dependent dehydrogenase (short-subunit alcohol dehydrogenase family)